jgi:hypothetical protein
VRYRGADAPGGGWPGTYRDVAAAADSLRALARRFPLDTTRVVALGHSAGAPLAGWLAARAAPPADDAARAVRGPAPLRVRGVVAVDGPLDLAAARPAAPEICGEPILDRLLGGAPDAQPARWRTASPAAWLAAPRGRAAAAAPRQAVVVGQLDAILTAKLPPAAALREHARRSGAAVFVATRPTTSRCSTRRTPPGARRATPCATRWGRPPATAADADRAALAEAYRTIEGAFRAASLDAAVARLAPDFVHRALDGRGGVRTSSRAQFVAGVSGMAAALDSLAAFDIDVTGIDVRGDSAEVRYRERMDARWKAREPGGAPVRQTSTSWWRDRWVRTPAGWRAVRFEEVAAPAAGAR